MTGDMSRVDDLLHRAEAGDERARTDLFEAFRQRLRGMVRLRLDRRLTGRIDPSDVLQEAYLDYERRLPEFFADRKLPFFLWLRGLTGQRLVDLHRMHLGAQMRDAGQEVSLYQGALPAASSVSLANQLLGRLTSPTQAAVRAEMQVRLQEALNAMDTLDLGHIADARECLAKGMKWIEEADKRATYADTGSTWIAWYERIEVQHLRAKAESLISVK
jgi:RNA polymerase sigma-70 factor (ECF subfamily)